MIKELDGYDWESAFGEQNITLTYAATITCRGRVSLQGVTREAVAEIVAMEDGENDGPNWVGVFRLKDGRFVAISSGCDYTGWDCQAGGQCFVSDSLQDLVRYGLSEDERQRLKLQIAA